MQFRIGPWFYGLRIPDPQKEGPLKYRGREVMGLCREQTQELLISAKCPPQSRLSVLLHEYFHGWIFATGEPRSIEGWCDLFATAAVAAIDALSMNGGKEAILRLEAGEGPQPGAARIALTRNRYCGKCQQTVAGGSVRCWVEKPGARSQEPEENSPQPTPNNQQLTTRNLLNLELDCEHCGLTQRWQETATVGGMPSGMVVGEARWEKMKAQV